MQIDVISSLGARIGESPTWVPDQRALFWMDVKKPALYRLYVDTDLAPTCWTVSSDIGAFALLPGDLGAVVALREGVFHLDFASRQLSLLAVAPFDPKVSRFNEGACDSTGRFWIGTMFDPLAPTKASYSASLYSFTLTQGLRAEPDAAELHNGMAWSPDESRFYLAHTLKHTVFRFDYDAKDGLISCRTPFAVISGDDGVPDGAAVDSEGGYWCALHGGGKIRRYFPNGTIDREIALPVSQPTMCAFGGEALQNLFITSSTDGLSMAQREREPLAGAVLRIRTKVRGAPRFHTVR